MKLAEILKRPILIFDLETTGLDVKKDRIIQFAAVRIEPSGAQFEWNILVNPAMKIADEILKLTGLDEKEIKKAPFLKSLKPLMPTIFEGADIAGFNADQYDAPLLQAEFDRCGIGVDISDLPVLDAMQIYHRLTPPAPGRTLSAAVQFYLGADHEAAHNALGDVRATVAVLEAQFERHAELGRSVDGALKYLADSAVTADGKIIWQGENAVLSFGKHAGRPLQQLAKSEAGYLEWMLSSNFPAPVKKIVAAALAGNFPKKA